MVDNTKLDLEAMEAPVDLSTAEGRADFRNRLATLSAWASIAMHLAGDTPIPEILARYPVEDDWTARVRNSTNRESLLADALAAVDHYADVLRDHIPARPEMPRPSSAIQIVLTGLPCVRRPADPARVALAARSVRFLTVATVGCFGLMLLWIPSDEMQAAINAVLALFAGAMTLSAACALRQQREGLVTLSLRDWWLAHNPLAEIASAFREE